VFFDQLAARIFPGRGLPVPRDYGTHLRIDVDGFSLRCYRSSRAVVLENKNTKFKVRPEFAYARTPEESRHIADRFIRETLLPLAIVQLSGFEEMEFLDVRHVRSRVVSAEGNVVSDQPHAAMVVYGRRVDGVPVYGPGSKIVIHIDTAGEIAGYDVLWRPLGPPTGDVIQAEVARSLLRQATTKSSHSAFVIGYHEPDRLKSPTELKPKLIELREDPRDVSRMQVVEIRDLESAVTR
jgi:hypothetical protein